MNNVAILLTSAVYSKAEYRTFIFAHGSIDNSLNTNSEKRLLIYKKSIQNWLEKTDLVLFIVDSTGYKYEEYSTNQRIKICSFVGDIVSNCKGCDSTVYEADSILKAFEYFKFSEYDFIIKITGKYFIPNINNLISVVPPDTDLIFQSRSILHIFFLQQPCEIFGCKTKHLENIMNKVLQISKKSKNFEYTLDGLNDKGEYKIYRLPEIKLDYPVQRGDGITKTSL